MWTAYMLVIMVNIPQPMAMKDQRGPYDTEAACRDRVVEMRSSALKMLPGVVSILGRCVEGESGDIQV